MLLFYIRHGDPIYSPDGLTEQGVLQAEALSKRLAVYGLDKIYASTSNRAQLTAKPTAEKLNLPVIPLEWCHEQYAARDFGLIKDDGNWDWCFRAPQSVLQLNSPEATALGDTWYEAKCFENTRYKEGVLRVNEETDKFLLSLGYEHDRKTHTYKAVRPNDEKVALFAHQGFGLAFLSSVLDIPYNRFATHIDLGHSSMTVIHFDGEDVVVARMIQCSNDSHIYKEGLPLAYQNTLNF